MTGWHGRGVHTLLLALVAFACLASLAVAPAAAQSVPTGCKPNAGASYDCVMRRPTPYTYMAGNTCLPGLWISEADAHSRYMEAFAACPSTQSPLGWISPLAPKWSVTDFGAGCGSGSPSQWPIPYYSRESSNWLLSQDTWHYGVSCSLEGSGVLGVMERNRSFFCPDGYGTHTQDVCSRAAVAVDPAKNSGKLCPKPGQCLVGNPINAGTGNKFQLESDYRSPGEGGLEFARAYNSAPYTGGNVPDHFYFPNLVSSFGTAGYLQLVRNSSEAESGYANLELGAIGLGWRHSYQRSIQIESGNLLTSAFAYRPDGRVLSFTRMSGQWYSQADIDERVSETASGWQLALPDDSVETYDNTGRLLSIRTRGGLVQTLAYDACQRLATVTDSFGKVLTFGYGAGCGELVVLHQITSVTVPGGGTYHYWYDSTGRLTSVTYPDSRTRQYLYENSAFPLALTGIIDENGIRYATFGYDSDGRATSTEHAGGAEHISIAYTPSSGRSVTSAAITRGAGSAQTYTFTTVQGMQKVATQSAYCEGCAGNFSALTYDANGNVASRTDFRGSRTCYAYDLTRNLETARVEGFASGVSCPANVSTYTPASGTRERKITTQWHSTFRLPISIAQSDHTTGLTYDAAGNVISKTITDTSVTPNVSRIWTYTYDSYGRVLTEDGPRADVTDVTTYTYYSCTTGYQCGQLHTITNALSQTTTFNTYNAHGQPLTITDANGVVATLAYDSRLRITSREVDSEETTFLYWPTGLLKKVTLPDASFVLYTYDDAHRLIRIEDGEGNHIDYTLDAMGNRTAENAYDPSSSLARTRTQVFNGLNQLWKQVGAAGTPAVTTVLGYDNNGNPTSVAAPLSRNTANQYDELNRLKQITDPATGVTQFAYDANDRLTSVTDPRGNATSYLYNGFGDLTQQVSPDTGTTASSYDPGGNLATRTDARSRTGTYTYDALNRVTSIAYPDLTTSFTYDAGTNGVGHLTGASDANHTLSFTYDAQGRVTGKTQTVGTIARSVSYGYTNGNLTSLVTPSGQTIGYGYTEGRITSITLNGSTTVLNQVLYEPFGPVSGWSWGNGTITARVHDTDGRISDIDSAGLKTYSYDDASRIASIEDADTPSLNASYNYDVLDRLIDGSVPASPTLSVSATSAVGGQSVAVTVNDAPLGSGYWLALANTAAPSTTYSDWVQVVAQNGSFVWNVTMPAFAGTYEVRLFRGFGQVAGSAAISVSAPSPPAQPAISVSATHAAAGVSLTMHLSGASGNSTDWLGLSLAGSASTSYQQWVYVGSGVTSRDWTVVMPNVAGSYELRLYLNNGYTIAATSPTVVLGGTAPVPAGADGVNYDANGNRLSWSGSTYTTAATSNRLLSVSGALSRTYSYDAAGNPSSDGTNTYTYTDAGRLRTVTRAGVTTTYIYNALGQRVKKSNSSLTRYFVYDEAGHLLGEYDGTGALVQETVWLDDIPVATLRPNGAGVTLYYVHTDHLNTPRRISRPSDNVIVWRWDSDAFGTSAANEDPDADAATLAYNLRFPGQYVDSESGTSYNYRRDYDPAVGRYIESDPIGLDGGTNTYAYVSGNPLSFSDMFGLRPLTQCEKDLLKPYIPDIDLQNADLQDGRVPWYLRKGFDGITRGNTIYFRPGVYASDTVAGIGLLGHELVHVGQYRQGMTWLDYLVESRKGYENSKYEKEAYAKQAQIEKDLEKAGSKGCEPCKE